MVGRLIASADALISLEVRALRSAETGLPECREQEGLLMRQCRSGEWSSMMKAMVYYKNGGPEVFQWTDVDVPAWRAGPGTSKTSISQSRAGTQRTEPDVCAKVRHGEAKALLRRVRQKRTST
jgi:hypothetical protein